MVAHATSKLSIRAWVRMHNRVGQCSKHGGLRRSTVVDITLGGRSYKEEMRYDVQDWCTNTRVFRDEATNIGTQI